MATTNGIVNSLWVDGNAEEMAKFYTSIFKKSKMGRTAYYGEEGFEEHHHRAGDVLTVEFELNGSRFIALNGGPDFKFNEATSFMIECKDQKEIDHYWNKLSEGGDPKSQQCGWLKDKFGLSWQVVPDKMKDWSVDKDSAKTERMMHEMFKMKKLDYDVLEKAFNGELVDA